MKDALILIHLPAEHYWDALINKIRAYAQKYLDKGRLVYQLLDNCAPCELRLQGTIIVPHGPGAPPGIEQILDIKERLKANNVSEAEVCGMSQICVGAISEQLSSPQVDPGNEILYEERIRRLKGYKVDVKVLEHLCA